MAVIQAKDIRVWFTANKPALRFFGARPKVIKAVDGLSLSVSPGEVVSLVGESGSGKTTTGKAMLQLAPLSGGEVIFEGARLNSADRAQMQAFRRSAQIIYQDPYQSLNPRDIIEDIVAEPLQVNRLITSQAQRDEAVEKALCDAGLSPAREYLGRYPYELSGGQRQRVVIAAAMIMGPKFVVADEPVSMLDASIRTGVLRLMMRLREERGLSYLFITHDLSLAWLISARIAIMYLGKIVELASADEVIYRGQHPYTRALVGVMPVAGVVRKEKRELLKGESQSGAAQTPGCCFCARCPLARKICAQEAPVLRQVAPGHGVACHII